MRRLAISAVAMLLVVVVGCSPGQADPAEPETLEGWANGDVAFQSAGYSCGADPTAGCAGETDMSLVEVWLHEMAQSNDGEEVAGDCVDMLVRPQNGSLIVDLYGLADTNPLFAGTGWGVRVVELDEPPEGLSVGGEAWFEVTVSSFSASEFAAQRAGQPGMAPPSTEYPVPARYRAPTNGDPTSIKAPPDTTLYIEELVLVDTTEDMMRWIIVMKEDLTYRHRAMYSGFNSKNTLTIQFVS